ncbi:MAG: RNA polymerase-binding protein DksA [Ramlibacter sp.]
MKAPAKKAKPATKSPQKPVAKAKPTATAKPVAAKKAAAKPAAKKAPVKPVAKPAAKARPVAAKPAAKATAKSKPVAKPAAKKVVAKPVIPAKTAAKPAAKPVAAKPPAAKPAKAPLKSAAPARVAVVQPAPKPQTVTAVVAPPVPAKAPKPSSRLAQITVPSMAQSVASTAAKSSYSPAMPSPVLVSPPSVSAKKDPKLANNWKSKPAEQLSDAEVMAMPDSEYMNDKQMAFFRFKLSQLKQDILNSAGETTEHLREDTVIVPDPADRATIEEEHALELRTRDRERKLLKKIEQSIQRIDAGDYGYCDETGEPIGVGRLLARPTATLSLEAQQRRELKQKMFGD